MHRMLPAIEWEGAGIFETRLDTARVVYQLADLFEDHASAVIDASLSLGEEYAIVFSDFRLPKAQIPDPPLDAARIDLRRLVETLHLLKTDPHALDEWLSGEVGTPVGELLSPTIPMRWVWFSERESWIFASWDYGDINALGGKRAFLDEYLRCRPQAANEVVEWLLGEGSMFSRQVTVSDATSFLDRLLGRKTRIEDRFEDSSLQRYLSRTYSAETALELWQIYEGILAAESAGDPGRLDPHQRFERYLAEKPSVADRLREIWNAG